MTVYFSIHDFFLGEIKQSIVSGYNLLQLRLIAAGCCENGAIKGGFLLSEVCAAIKITHFLTYLELTLVLSQTLTQQGFMYTV